MKIIRIYGEVFENETDAILYTNRIDYYARIAACYCRAGDKENALLYVEKATQDAIHYCTIDFEGYKSSLLVGRSYDHEHHARLDARNECWKLREGLLKWREFEEIENIKSHERFVKCIEALKAHSHEIRDYWS